MSSLNPRYTPFEGRTGASTVPTSCGASSPRASAAQVTIRSNINIACHGSHIKCHVSHGLHKQVYDLWITRVVMFQLLNRSESLVLIGGSIFLKCFLVIFLFPPVTSVTNKLTASSQWFIKTWKTPVRHFYIIKALTVPAEYWNPILPKWKATGFFSNSLMNSYCSK